MAITDSQKVDYLFKKVGYSVAKTDTSTVKSPSNESISSPLVIRGGSIWTNSDNIPSTIPTSNSSVVSLYKDSLTSTVQTTNDGTASANRTWLTNLTDWIDPSFGSTYQVKVYLDTAGNTAPQTTGTQLFADGTGSDEWFFDYASGVLNFIGTSLPSASFTGKRIFVSGARYIGNKGLGNLGNTTISGTITANAFIQNGRAVLDTITSINVTGDVTGTGNVANIALTLANTGVVAGIYGAADDEIVDRVPKITVDSKGRITSISNVALTQIGNVSFSNTTISTTSSITLNSANNGNITLNADGTGIVKISGNDAVAIPSGNTSVRPTNVAAGYIRFNTDIGTIEFYNGTGWDNNNQSGTITSQTISPTGATNVYTLLVDATTDGVLVSINGTLQQPTTAYTVAGNVITFTETPLTTDIIEVRAISLAINSITAISDGNTRIETNATSGDITLYNYGTNYLKINQAGTIVGLNPNTAIASSGVATTIDTYSSTLYRTAKYIVQATRSTNMESYEVLVTHNGTTAYSTTYGIINSGTALGTISATISGANVLVQYTATSTNTNIRLSKNYLII